MPRLPRSFDWPTVVLALRDRLQTTQAELARLMGTADSTVSKWERGETLPAAKMRRALVEVAVKAGFPVEHWPKDASSVRQMSLPDPAAARNTDENMFAALRTFRDGDWSFTDKKTSFGVHALHPYPAKFIPQIPGGLLDLFHPIVGGRVVDPFCGSGTTLVECCLRGIPCTGIDLNPIATLISTVKSRPPSKAIAPMVRDLIHRASRNRTPPLANIPNVKHWFVPAAIKAMSALSYELFRMPQSSELDAIKLVFSKIVVRSSRQDSDTRYAAVDRNITAAEVFILLEKAAEQLDRALFPAGLPLYDRPTDVSVLCRDILSVSEDDVGTGYGMVITSPPYPNAYEYWLYHKYRMYWLGQDPLAVKKAEIGARPHYFRRKPATPAEFAAQIGTCFDLFGKMLSPKGIVCIVVGRSIIHGEEIDNKSLIAGAASAHGFRRLAEVARSIPQTKKGFNPSHAMITKESISIFAKEAAYAVN